MRVYFDSVTTIYYVQHVAPHAAAIGARIATPGTRIAVSDLTRLECRVKPIRAGDPVLLAEFDAAFAVAELVTLTTAVFDRATVIRASQGYKTVDSIHLAAAVESGCDVFLTNDRQLARFPDIHVEVI